MEPAETDRGTYWQYKLTQQHKKAKV
jgi:hypothetical protein